MADVRYEDIRRAAEEAVRGLESAVGDVRGIVQGIIGHTGSIGDVQTRATDLQQALQRVESQLHLTSEMVGQLRQIAQGQAQLHARLDSIEDTTNTIHASIAEIHDHLSALRQAFTQQTESSP